MPRQRLYHKQANPVKPGQSEWIPLALSIRRYARLSHGSTWNHFAPNALIQTIWMLLTRLDRWREALLSRELPFKRVGCFWLGGTVGRVWFRYRWSGRFARTKTRTKQNRRESPARNLALLPDTL